MLPPRGWDPAGVGGQHEGLSTRLRAAAYENGSIFGFPVHASQGLDSSLVRGLSSQCKYLPWRRCSLKTAEHAPLAERAHRRRLSQSPHQGFRLAWRAVGQGCCGASVLGRGIPRAASAPQLRASATWLGEQKSSRKIWAKFRSRALADREKRSMHWTTGRAVSSGWEPAPGEPRPMSVVTADSTVSSLRLDRQLTMRGMPPACRMYSLLALSAHRLQRPPGEEQADSEASALGLLRPLLLESHWISSPPFQGSRQACHGPASRGGH